ncbi:MAG TPA: hypothetical protein VF531_15855 [Bacillota bacterium]
MQHKKMLITGLKEAFGDRLRTSGENAGLHLMVEFLDCSFTPPDLERLKNMRVIVDWVEDYASCLLCVSL